MTQPTVTHMNLKSPLALILLLRILHTPTVALCLENTVFHFISGQPLIKYDFGNPNSVEHAYVYRWNYHPLSRFGLLAPNCESAVVFCQSDLEANLSHLTPFFSLSAGMGDKEWHKSADDYAREKDKAVQEAIDATWWKAIHSTLIDGCIGIVLGLVIIMNMWIAPIITTKVAIIHKGTINRTVKNQSRAGLQSTRTAIMP